MGIEPRTWAVGWWVSKRRSAAREGHLVGAHDEGLATAGRAQTRHLGEGRTAAAERRIAEAPAGHAGRALCTVAEVSHVGAASRAHIDEARDAAWRVGFVVFVQVVAAGREQH